MLLNYIAQRQMLPFKEIYLLCALHIDLTLVVAFCFGSFAGTIYCPCLPASNQHIMLCIWFVAFEIHKEIKYVYVCVCVSWCAHMHEMSRLPVLRELHRSQEHCVLEVIKTCWRVFNLLLSHFKWNLGIVEGKAPD